MQIKIINRSNNPLPNYATEGAAGLDLRAFLERDFVLLPQQRALIPTGIHIELPQGYEAQIRPRSGLAAKRGVFAIFGTIDSDYRGAIHVLLYNASDVPFTIKNGERIAQMVITTYQKVQLVEVENLSETLRGEGGFGSTGLH
ncbi:MAG: dUTP diphosphatase [Microscillaceae bacterium]|nr:dUTP diphosphatase [Microscillaceae bacterium]MDW8461017.1 dUTP diphosphatase [Cytophagales bacterium]